MKTNWNEYYNQCNESNDQTINFKYYAVNSKKKKSTNKNKWREIENIKEQQKLRRELMDLLEYY